jgi:hypothetical protein
MTDAASFRLRNVVHNTRLSHDAGTENQQVRTGVRQGDATCVSCGHAWTARAGVTGLLNMLGGVRLECPNCEARGSVRTEAFE